ncbi:hypothetical protein EPK99_19480 [Neorhizobium lilium]|uniref:Uncharacterized protein n=1 Tax=Neorhizobium lilium TaxID=2503024 RepID=A0A444LDD6_9HYPH|nr:hypothetical protein [Neorhizobium lilium]RWX75863.1 hypothetical protein EPK99_19480 [Neorhizobium lilium]
MQKPLLSIRLTPDIQQRLDAEARASSQEASDVAAAAIETYLDHQADKRAQALEAIAAADQGTFISGEKMKEWISSWGSENETTAPDPDIFPRSTRAL